MKTKFIKLNDKNTNFPIWLKVSSITAVELIDELPKNGAKVWLFPNFSASQDPILVRQMARDVIAVLEEFAMREVSNSAYFNHISDLDVTLKSGEVSEALNSISEAITTLAGLAILSEHLNS